MHWLQIAASNEHDARAARAQSAAMRTRDAAFGEALTAEMHASLVAITAASHAIDALYGEVKPLISIPEEACAGWERNKTPRHSVIFETLKRGCRLGVKTNTWPAAFDALYLLRDPVVHHEAKPLPAVPHPVGGTNVSQETADYVVENVEPSLALAFDVVLTTLRQPRAPDLVTWANAMPHVPATIEGWRTPG